MGKDSLIEWTDHTFNPWWGCVPVSSGCANCYAEALSKRTGFRKVWGAETPRRHFKTKHWRQPFQWNHAAIKNDTFPSVFCGSMCDIFEINLADDLIPYAREQLWKMIEMTDHLMWLLLTKRPENVLNLVPWETHADWPINVATGTSVEDQNTAAARIPLLLEIPAWFKFLSIEPMIGPVDLEASPEWLYQMTPVPIHDPDGSFQDCDYHVEPRSDGIDWVIVGGESGSNARPMDLAWVRDLREQCVRADISFFVKQLGSHWAKSEDIHKIRGHKKGEGILSWPEDLRIQQKPLAFSSRHVFTAPEKSQKGA